MKVPLFLGDLLRRFLRRGNKSVNTNKASVLRVERTLNGPLAVVAHVLSPLLQREI